MNVISRITGNFETIIRIIIVIIDNNNAIARIKNIAIVTVATT